MALFLGLTFVEVIKGLSVFLGQLPENHVRYHQSLQSSCENPAPANYGMNY